MPRSRSQAQHLGDKAFVLVSRPWCQDIGLGLMTLVPRHRSWARDVQKGHDNNNTAMSILFEVSKRLCYLLFTIFRPFLENGVYCTAVWRKSANLPLPLRSISFWRHFWSASEVTTLWRYTNLFIIIIIIIKKSIQQGFVYKSVFRPPPSALNMTLPAFAA